MSGPTPDERPGRERGPVTELVRLFLGQLAAVIGIAAAIVVLVAVLRPHGSDGISGEIRAATPKTSGPATSASSTPASSSPAAPSTTSASATATPPGSASTSPAETPSALPVKVDVLNQSAGQGAADRVAQRLQGAGWEIGRIDDFHGNVSTTTVYWLDPEQRRQARQVSRFLGGVRVLEGFDTLVDGRVSVVLVDGSW